MIGFEKVPQWRMRQMNVVQINGHAHCVLTFAKNEGQEVPTRALEPKAEAPSTLEELTLACSQMHDKISADVGELIHLKEQQLLLIDERMNQEEGVAS